MSSATTGVEMRIVLLVESLQLAGAERVVLELARAGHGEGCEAHIVTLRDERILDDGPYRGVGWQPLFSADEFRWPWSVPMAARRLRRTVARLRPDVVAIHSPKTAIVAALARISAPTLWVLHGHDVCWDAATVRRKMSRELQRWARRILRARVAAVSPSLADDAARGLGLAREEIVVIPNGVDTERFTFEEHVPTDDVIVGFLGRLISQKGPLHALESFAILKKKFPSARLWFVGDGPMRDELTSVAGAKGWNDDVRFWGSVPRPEEYLRQATVLWHTSECEGFGLACAEAMASGVPVVGFDVRGIRDLLTGGCGVLVPPKDARELAVQTALLVCDASRYRAIARDARTRVENQYSLEQMCRGHYELMRAICADESATMQHASVSTGLSPSESIPERVETDADKAPLFTVVTPTYNRAGTLRRPYESLCRQTLRDFEWLVVDDGSTDSTRDVIEIWQHNANFPIRYVWQENAGKAAAWNRALELARGEFFVCLDSDDECVADALSSFKEHWENIPAKERDRFSGVTVLAMDQNGAPYGPDLPMSPLDCSHLAVTYRLKRFQDSWQCYRTEIIREYPFELIAGYCNYLPETTVINRLAASYLQRHVNRRMLKVHTGERTDVQGHQSCGVNASAGLKHAPGIRAAHLSLFRHQIGWFSYAPVRFYRAAANYIRFSWMQGISARTQIGEVGSMRARALWLAALPAGIALRLNDRLVERRAKQ